MQWTIEVQDVRAGGQRSYRFGQNVVRVGRDPGLDISLNHAEVSRLHFTLYRVGERVRLEDRSRNGTFRRRDGRWERVEGTAELELPARLRAGQWTFEVAADEVAEAAPEAVPQRAPEATWEQSVMLPAGYLKTEREAILVFDLCESSQIAAADDHMAHHLKRRLVQLAEPVLENHGRRFFKSTGDGFLATFAEPGAALAAAIELESRIHNRNRRTRNAPLHYRIALHVGVVWAIEAGGDDIHGNDVNITFRIEGVQADAFDGPRPALPARDRILCSRAFLGAAPREQLEGALDGHVACGPARLKGIAEPIDVHWLKTSYSHA